MKKYKFIDLFAGCGGLEDGFLQSGRYIDIAAVEWLKPQVNTLIRRLETKWKVEDAAERVMHFDIQRETELFAGWDDEKFGSGKGLDYFVNKAQGIDVIIPVPLHKKKQQIRGYNQSEWIARGITAVTGIPVDTEMIVRRKNTETQTHKSVFERWENVDGIFELHHVGALAGKHILLVDDVLTTGATTAACAACLAEIEGIHISILTLAIAE